MNVRKLLTLVAAATLGLSGAVVANPILMLQAGAVTVTIADQQAGPPPDSNPQIGAVTYIGGVGGWTTNVTTGLGSVVLGGDPHLDLNSVNVSTFPGGGPNAPLEIWFTETGFTTGIGNVSAFGGEIGGTLASMTGLGKIEWWVYIDTTNVAFGTGTMVAGDSTSSSPFAQSDSGAVYLNGPYSMTLRVRITHPDGNGIATSFNFSAQLVPEPGTLLLIGAGLIGFALMRRKVS
jgi:hypothetical protein